MGKMLLFLVAATTIGGTLMLSQRLGTERVGNERQALDDAQLLAREITRSAYALGASRVQASFFERPLYGDVAYEGVAFGEGTYDLYMLELPCGAMRVTATGKLTVPVANPMKGTATTTQTHTMQGDYVALAEMPGSLLVDAAASDVSFSQMNSAEIISEDHRPACEDVQLESWDQCTDFSTVRRGMGGVKPKIRTNNSVLNSVLGGGVPLLSATDPFPSYVQALYDDAYALATMTTPDPYVHYFGSWKEFASTHRFGSPTEPVVMVIEGDAKFTGNTTGYGVLIVHGNLDIKSKFTWGGVIYVVKPGEVDVKIGGDSRVFGSLVVKNDGSGGDVDIELYDQAKLYYSAESVALLGAVLDNVSVRSEIARINERHTPATSFPQLECPGPSDTPDVEPGDDCECRSNNKKVAVMHKPPGNPENEHLICISKSALSAHVRNHGDTFVCESL